MSDQANESEIRATALPDNANLEWLRKQTKRRLVELRASHSDAKLADAQFELAKAHGFSSWRELKSHIDALTVEGQAIEAVRSGDAVALRAILDAYHDVIRTRVKPYAWSLLHLAAQHGRLAVVDLLLAAGLPVDVREEGDNTTPLFWAVAGGHLDVVRRLVAAGADVNASGDDHELGVIGWATCWDNCDDDAHHAVVDFLLTRGAHHHIFSAIALGLGDEVRRIATADPTQVDRRMSRNENRQTTLHFAVRMNSLETVQLLLELGADPFALDDAAMPIAIYARSTDADRPVMEAIRARESTAPTGQNVGSQILVANLALSDWENSDRLVRREPVLLNSGALHEMAKRGDARAVHWLLDQGADPNALRAHWDANLTAMHLAAWHGHADVVRLLLDAGGDPAVRDTKHNGDVAGWAEHGGHPDVAAMISAR